MRTASAIFIPALFVLLVSFELKPKKLFTPPGTVQLNETIYFDQIEVSNGEWREYEKWMESKYGKDSEQHRKVVPDTLVWRHELAYNEPYVDYYYRHPAYNDYPLVGISYGQAAGFCKWRTGKVRDLIKTGEYERQVLPKSVTYRLPTAEEWETAAKAGYDEKAQKIMSKKKWEGVQWNNMISDRETYLAQAGTGKSVTYNADAEITAPVATYLANSLGIYNLFGNVAEMTLKEGISKGGSWRDKRSEATVEKDYPYDGAEAWLGFRCVCEVVW